MRSIVQQSLRRTEVLVLAGFMAAGLAGCGGGDSRTASASAPVPSVPSSSAVPSTPSTSTPAPSTPSGSAPAPSAVTSSLTVTKAGSGTVAATAAGSISCGSTCSSSVANGTSVTLVATPDSGYSFAGWGGACSGTGNCTLMISTNTVVTATFSPNTGSSYTLSVSKLGSGTVTSSPSGVDCGSTCGASFPSGTAVTLSATPNSGYAFSGWGGACSGTGTCSVSMSASRSVNATFAASSGGGSPTIAAHTIKADASGSGTSPMTTPAITTPSGSLVLVQVLTQNSGTLSSLGDNKGNTYARVDGAKTYVGGGAGSYLYKAENIVGGTGHTWSLTKTAGYADNEATLFIVVIPNASGIGAYSYSNTGTYSGGALTTTAANSLVISFWGPADYSGGTANYTAPAGWTRLDQATNAANSNSGADAYTLVAASGTSINSTWTSNQSIQSGSSMWLVEVKP